MSNGLFDSKFFMCRMHICFFSADNMEETIREEIFT